MRILLCNYEYPPLGGGGGVVCAWLAQELARRHEVTVLTSGGLDLPESSVESGVRVRRVPIWGRDQRAVASLLSMASYVANAPRHGRALLLKDKYDLINTHFVVPTGPVGDKLARFAGVPNVLSLHGGDLYDPSKSLSPHRHRWLRWRIRRLLRRADRVVAQSQNTLANARRFYDPELSGRLIPLGIPRPPAATTSRAAFGLREDQTLLVTLGRLIPRKAVDQLIAMLPSLPDDTRLLILGEGPLEAELRRLAAERHVSDRVRFLGRVSEPEKFAILRLCDAFVSTSQHEGFGLVFLEAMACGLPVVCYDHGGQTDFLRHGQSGYLLPLNDESGFGARVRELATDAERRRAMGADNRARAEEYFIDRCAERYETLFAEVVGRRDASLAEGDELGLAKAGK